MSSSRLQGKVLMDVLGEPMLARQIERIRMSRNISEICVATSVDSADDPIVKLCSHLGVHVSRGSLHDVLDRYYQAALVFEPLHVVRLTGDCPLIDPGVVDQAINLHTTADADYTSNTIHPTFPDGLDVEVFRYEALKRAWQEARLASEREHVTPYIKNSPNLFRLAELRGHRDLSALRWTVDYARDLQMVREVFACLYPQNPRFDLDDVLNLLARRPDIAGMNVGVERDEGYKKSIAEDRLV
jgi:spore coat polysaccharide biosynthesis protein SpsF